MIVVASRMRPIIVATSPVVDGAVSVYCPLDVPSAPYTAPPGVAPLMPPRMTAPAPAAQPRHRQDREQRQAAVELAAPPRRVLRLQRAHALDLDAAVRQAGQLALTHLQREDGRASAARRRRPLRPAVRDPLGVHLVVFPPPRDAVVEHDALPQLAR